MKIEQISENKVRVSITNAEMTEMNIRPEMFAAGGKELNTFLFNIMDEISKQTDFDPYFGSLTMEAIHDTDGMSIMISKGIDTSRLGDQTGSKSVGDEIDELKTLAGILSKLSAIADVSGERQGGDSLSGVLAIPRKKLERQQGHSTAKKRRKIKSVRAVKEDNPQEFTTYIFESFEDMCHTLQNMSDMAVKRTELYNINGHYAFILPNITLLVDDAAMIIEYALNMRSRVSCERVREHGKLIAEGEKLMDMRDKIENLI